MPSNYATKLLAWLGLYNKTAASYNNDLIRQDKETNPLSADPFATANHTGGRRAIQKRGVFKFALAELVYGYDYAIHGKPVPGNG